MATQKIVSMPGDGIGNTVLPEAIRVLSAAGFEAEYIPADIGWQFWITEGNALPQRTIDLLTEHKLGLFGAITSKPKDKAAAEISPALRDKGYVYYSPIVGLRQHFDLDFCIRPCRSFKGNPLNFIRRKDGGFEEPQVDVVIFRQNTEGLYAGVEWTNPPAEVRKALETHAKMAKFKNVPSEDLAVSTRIFSRGACHRICKGAFEYAKKFGYKSVTVCEKPNVIRETSGLMVREARAAAKDYPGIELWETNIDAMCMWLVKNPQNYGVLVSSNMFGDILSDLAAQIVGGLGFACAGNIGDNYAVFEPTHGSAPKYVGQNKVNPIAMIRSAKMMLDYLGETALAEKIETAVARTIAEGRLQTYDMGGSTTTTEMAEAIAQAAKEA